MTRKRHKTQKTLSRVLFMLSFFCCTFLQAQEDVLKSMNDLSHVADYQGIIDYSNEVLRNPSTPKEPLFTIILPGTSSPKLHQDRLVGKSNGIPESCNQYYSRHLHQRTGIKTLYRRFLYCSNRLQFLLKFSAGPIPALPSGK